MEVIGAVLCTGVIIWHLNKLAPNMTVQEPGHSSSTTIQSNAPQCPEASLENMISQPDETSAITGELKLPLSGQSDRDAEQELQYNLTCLNQSSVSDITHPHNVTPPFFSTKAKIEGIDINAPFAKNRACVCMQHLDKNGNTMPRQRIDSGGCSDVCKGALLNNHGHNLTHHGHLSMNITNDVHHLEVTGRLTITVKKIARGGYSNVSKGVLTDDKGNTIEVAIKTFRNRGSTELEDVSALHKKILKEINIWGRLNHPNVAPLLGLTIPVHEPPSLISPWFENGNVATYLESRPQADQIRIFCDLSRGLAYLHSQDIVHGDIKPENALVDGYGRAHWCDFGLSHFLEGAAGCTGQTSSSTFRSGTTRFFSPEQVINENPPKRKTTMMDIWSFGCLIAQVMSGRQLYEDRKTDCHVAVAIFQGNLPINTSTQVALNPQLESLWTIVDTCWHKDPGARLTASAVLDLICKIVDGKTPYEIEQFGKSEPEYRPSADMLCAQIEKTIEEPNAAQ
ncbi:hypothetical protein FRC03_012863 [Tulasnella sp. 419]|nr:hypothetical protein FRC03_012863 [Tulasnella sp. 419]